MREKSEVSIIWAMIYQCLRVYKQLESLFHFYKDRGQETLPTKIGLTGQMADFEPTKLELKKEVRKWAFAK